MRGKRRLGCRRDGGSRYPTADATFLRRRWAASDAHGLATLAINLERAAGRRADVIDLDTAHLRHVQAEYLHAWAEAHRARAR